jgi:hypothetical protein
MARVLDYLGADGCLRTEPETTIKSPADGSAFNVTPIFSGTASSTNPLDRVEVQIRQPDGRYWNGQDWTADSTWLVAAGTTRWTYPLPPSVLSGTTPITSLNQGDHRLWARAWDQNGIVDPSTAVATFTFDSIPPEMPTLVAPADGVTLTAGPIDFAWRAPPDDGGSALGYNLQVEARLITVPVTHHVLVTWFPTGLHTWRVRTVDAAGNPSAWTDSRSFFMDAQDSHLPIVIKD